MMAYRTGLEWKHSFNRDNKQIFIPELEDEKLYVLKKINIHNGKVEYVFEEIVHL